MKILCCGDIHNDIYSLKLVLDKEKDHDIIILNGDITNFGKLKDFHSIMNMIDSEKVYINWGNCDTGDIINEIRLSSRDLDSKGYALREDIGIFGLSGSSPTPFKTFGEYSEDILYNNLKKGYESICEYRIKILFSHCPPYDTKIDKVYNNLSVGSKALRKFLEEYCIDYAICSHIHEAVGMDHLDNTNIYNIGAIKNRHYALINIKDNNIGVQLLSV